MSNQHPKTLVQSSTITIWVTALTMAIVCGLLSVGVTIPLQLILTIAMNSHEKTFDCANSLLIAGTTLIEEIVRYSTVGILFFFLHPQQEKETSKTEQKNTNTHPSLIFLFSAATIGATFSFIEVLFSIQSLPWTTSILWSPLIHIACSLLIATGILIGKKTLSTAALFSLLLALTTHLLYNLI